MIVGVIFNFYSLSTVGVGNRRFQIERKKMKARCFLPTARVNIPVNYRSSEP